MEDVQNGDSLLTPIETPLEFRVAVKDGRKLALFSAPWCGPCKLLKADLAGDEVLKSYLKNEEIGVLYMNLDIDELKILASEHGVRGIPHYVAYQDGEKLGQSRGYLSKDNFMSRLQDWFG